MSEEPGVWYVSTDADPSLSGGGTPTWKRWCCACSRRAGPCACALLEGPGPGRFFRGKSVYAVETAPGEYTFRLGGRRVSEVRLDPDSVGGIVTRFDGVELNPPGPGTGVCAGLGRAAALLALPPLAVTRPPSCGPCLPAQNGSVKEK